jgi:hypothetical protein
VVLLDNGRLKENERLSDVTAIQITGGNLNDTLLVNYNPGFFGIPITFNGDNALTSGFDTLKVIGESLTKSQVPSIAVNFVSASNGLDFSELSQAIRTDIGDSSTTVSYLSTGAAIVAVNGVVSKVTGTKSADTYLDHTSIPALTLVDPGGDNVLLLDPSSSVDITATGGGSNTINFSGSLDPIVATIGTTTTTVSEVGDDGTVTFTGSEGTYVGTVIGTTGDDTYIDQTTIETLVLIDGGGNNYFTLDPSSSIDITATGGGSNTINFSGSLDPIVATIGTTTTTVSEVGDDGTVLFTGNEETYVGTIIGTTGDDRYTDATTIETLYILDGGGNNYFTLDPSSTIDITATGGGSNTIDFSTSQDPIVANVGATITEVEEVENAASNVLFTSSGGSFVGAVIGTSGDDTFIDSTTHDQLWDGGAGDDIFDAQPSSSITIIEDSSGGIDTLRLHRAFFAVDANLKAGMVTDANGNQVFIRDRDGNLSATIENMSGTAFSDVIRGTDGDNVLFGVGGNDIFDGGAGNDIYVPVLGGNVVIFDASGNDTIDYSAASGGINLDLSRSNGSMQSIDTSGSKLALFGEIENAIGTSYDDSITGGGANNILVGQGGNDRLLGQSGHDVLIGGAGDDEINGGSDRDIAVGGRGADRINAGSGQDILISGFTVYDTAGTMDLVDLDAWTAIRAAWIDGNEVAVRIAAIRTGVGPLGQYRLASTGAGATVENNDGATDVLTGGQAADWFFVLLPPDVITDNDDQEFIN